MSEKCCFSPEMSLKFSAYQNINDLLILRHCFFFCIQKPSIFSSCFGDNDSMDEHMSHCLASASLFHTLTKMESELWEALQGGMALG